MEKDPQVVAHLAEQRDSENWRFRTYLKTSTRLSRSRVDALAARLGQEAEAEMDCTSCAACCRHNWVPLIPEEISRLAERKGLSVEEFRARYVTVHPDGEEGIDARPCPLLEGRLCSVYEDRPEPCRGYPYVGGNVASRMIGIIERAGTCPIIFDMLERLKEHLGFQRLC